MAHEETVLDLGPIVYQDIELFGDPDLEHGLRHLGLDPAETTYRLRQILVEAIGETRSMTTWKWTSQQIIETMRAGQTFAPIVVFRTATGWNLSDGVNRTYAAWHLGRPTIRAYELIQHPA